MTKPWQHFIFCFIVQLLLPLMPIVIEYWIRGAVGEQTLSIAAAMYSISIGVSTRNLALLGVSIFTGMAFCCVFGFVTSGKPLHFPVATPAMVSIFAFMVIHAAERYKRHVSSGELFIDIGGRDV